MPTAAIVQPPESDELLGGVTAVAPAVPLGAPPAPPAVLDAPDDGRYFLMLTSGLSFAFARTHLGAEPSVGYEAFDLRVGAELGVELAHVFRPYALARGFGGPVFWRHQGEAVDGTDTHHYQLGLGASARLAKTLSVFAEGVPLGERAVSLGVGLAL